MALSDPSLANNGGFHHMMNFQTNNFSHSYPHKYPGVNKPIDQAQTGALLNQQLNAVRAQMHDMQTTSTTDALNSVNAASIPLMRAGNEQPPYPDRDAQGVPLPNGFPELSDQTILGSRNWLFDQRTNYAVPEMGVRWDHTKTLIGQQEPVSVMFFRPENIQKIQDKLGEAKLYINEADIVRAMRVANETLGKRRLVAASTVYGQPWDTEIDVQKRVERMNRLVVRYLRNTGYWAKDLYDYGLKFIDGKLAPATYAYTPQFVDRTDSSRHRPIQVRDVPPNWQEVLPHEHEEGPPRQYYRSYDDMNELIEEPTSGMQYWQQRYAQEGYTDQYHK